MPSNLPVAENIAINGVCLFRVAQLDSDCSVLGGNCTGYVTAGIIDFTATPDVEEGTVVQPKNGCGTTLYRLVRQDRVLGYNLSGNLGFFDDEGLRIMFGGTAVIGGSLSDFPNDTIGWASPNLNDSNNGVYLEVITQTVSEGAGDCITSGSGRPQYAGFIFGKVRLTLGEISLQEDAVNLPFTGKASNNPNLFNGPWNDWPGQGTGGTAYIPNSPLVKVGYSAAEYEDIVATIGAGCVDLPAGS